MKYSYEKYKEIIEKYKSRYKNGKRKKEDYFYWGTIYECIFHTRYLFKTREEAVSCYKQFIFSWNIGIFLDLFDLFDEDDVWSEKLFLPGYWGNHSERNEVNENDLFAGILVSEWHDTISQPEFLKDFVYILLNNSLFHKDYLNKKVKDR